jgi:lon-related putative ATP-dependent protease
LPKQVRELKPEELHCSCDPAGLGMETTAEVEPAHYPLGQERAISSLEFSTGIGGEGYNVFVMGSAGTGRFHTAELILEEAARKREAPPDWCYVHNFADPRCPRALSLPAGQGSALRHDMDELIANLDQAISGIFDSEDYQERRDEILRQFRDERQQEIAGFERQAEDSGLALVRGPGGLVVAPARDGEVLSAQDYAELSEEEREEVERRRNELQEELLDILRHGARREKEARDAVKALDREMVQFASADLIEELAEKYQELAELVQHLKDMMADLVENVAQFRDGEEHSPPVPLPHGFLTVEQSPYDRYRVNLLTERADSYAPVVHEANPTLHNLTGEVEYQTQMGALVTDFTMIRPGALHRANGGFLLLDALTVLRRPYAWEALTRCLKSREIRIESLGDQLRLISTVSLEPEPVPLDAKVVLVGSPLLYYLLYEYDEDFRKLFRVKADFSEEVERTPDTEQLYLRLVARIVEEHSLAHFDAAAVARIIEAGGRLAEDQEKLSTRLLDVENLVREAAYWAEQRDAQDLVQAQDVDRAVEERVFRSNRVEERLLEAIEEGTLKISTEGTAVGQINGLSLLPLGDYWVGLPARITARCYLGRPGVLNIEREVKLSGPVHDKGVLILSGYLGQQYATERPLSASISLAFEQSYQGHEGDSASAAELFALLSSIGELPLRQDIAVTGSVNQHGEIQPVGGVTRKVEGFFETCRTVGLTGTQGVLLPAANRRHLMLKSEVVEAVSEGRFHLWTMETVAEGLELLMGEPAGEKDADGEYPADSVHGIVQARLAEFAESYKEFNLEDGGPGGDDDGA